MANRKKISELNFAGSVSGDDEFLVVDKSTNVGDDASASGKTSKVTLNTIKNSMFPAGAPIQFWNENSNNIFFNTGNVGIGITSPDAPLHIKGANLGDAVNDTTTLAEIQGSRHKLLFKEHRHDSPSSNNWDGVTYKLQKKVDSTNMQSINFVHDNGAGAVNNHIDLYVGGHTSSDPVFSTRFAGNGNVGIGTTNPESKLEISNDNGVGDADLTFTDQGGISYSMGIKDGSQAFQISESTPLGQTPSDSLKGTRFLIDTNGNVGIGTTNPGAKLDVYKNFSGLSNVTAAVLGGDDGAIGFCGIKVMSKDDQSIQSSGSQTFSVISNNTTDFVVTGNGNVGIGTDSPAEKLHIKGDDARMFIGSDDYNLVSLGRRAITDLDAGYLALYSEGNRKVSIDTKGDTFFNGGNVGIGTETPTANLEIRNVVQHGATGLHIWNTSDGLPGDQGMIGAYTSYGAKTNNLSTGPDYSYYTGIDMTESDSPPTFRIGYAGSQWAKPNSSNDLVVITSGGRVGIGTGFSPDPTQTVAGMLHLNSYHEDGNAELVFNYASNMFPNTSPQEIGINYTDKLHIGSVHNNAPLVTMTLEKDGKVNFKGDVTVGDTLYLGGDAVDTLQSNNTMKRIVCAPMIWGGPNSSGNELASIDMGCEVSHQDDGNIIFKTSMNANDSEQPVHEYMHERMRIDPMGAVTMGSRIQEAYRLTLNVASNFAAIKNGLLITAETRDTAQNNHLIECRGRSNIGSVFQVNSDGAVYAMGGVNTMGLDVSDIDNVHETNMRGLETLNKIHVCDYTINGKTIVGCVSQDVKNALPSAISEIKKEVEVCPSKGNIIHGEGDSKLIVRANVTKNDFEKESWPESYQFEQTHDAETEDVTKLAVSQDQLIATLIKSVQELNAKVNRLTAEVRRKR